jgi:hypothetical protein
MVPRRASVQPSTCNAGDEIRCWELFMQTNLTGRIFYRVFLPMAVVVNLGLGVVVLSNLRPEGWLGWLVVATGAFCCIVAGWLAAAAWSKSYWGSAMARQIVAWRQIADAIFAWLEEAPLPAEALLRLKRSLDEVGHHTRSTRRQDS